jgi:hypothetical protein
LAYYGIHPYSYGDIRHDPQPLPGDSYVTSIIKHVTTVLPSRVFNSILITKYESGSDYLPPHSDNESSIEKDSVIACISMGGIRDIYFESNTGANLSVELPHGSVYCMTRQSQDVFRHGIPRRPNSTMRISITLRQLHPESAVLPDEEVASFLEDLASHSDKPPPNVATQYEPTASPPQRHFECPVLKDCEPDLVTNSTNHGRSTSVFISSSLFKQLDGKKLSSEHQDAIVFSFPGASAEEILVKLQDDRRFNNINPGSVKQIFLLCGSNNVDRILNVPRQRWRTIIDEHEFVFNRRKLSDALDGINNLGIFLHEWAVTAKVNIINILPRTSRARNVVINALNTFIDKFCDTHSFLKMIQTETSRHLFSDQQGHRKKLYFSAYGEDNVHLTEAGLSRLANHLKYVAHNNS